MIRIQDKANIRKIFIFKIPLIKIKYEKLKTKYYFFNLLPFFKKKLSRNEKKYYLFGVQIYKKYVFSTKDILKSGDIIKKLQTSTNSKGRILIIFHLNFLKNDMGCSSYVYEVAKLYKELGYSLDFFTSNIFGDSHEFDCLEQLNMKDNLIDNFYMIKMSSEILPKNTFDLTWGDQRVSDELCKIVHKNNYKYIDVHYIQWSGLFHLNKFSMKTKLIYHCQDISFFQYFYQSKDFSIMPQTFNWELTAIKIFDKVFCISYDELLFWKKFFPEKEFYFMPHPLEQKQLNNDTIKNIDILFLGHLNPFNIEGVLWFLNQVYPFISKNLCITICGRVINGIKEQYPEEYLRLKSLKFNLIEFEDDLNSLYAKTKIVVVPLQGGTGMKIKTIQAMSYNIPIVSTLAGVDGFPDKTNNGILVTDDPKKFAQFLNKLLHDKEYYLNQSRKIKEYFSNNFSRTMIKKILDKGLG